ncbi:bifunctional ABC transporter-like [Babesia duncani]|uniref:Bifunctional ABC transporter-like n=1 Tax=Babesia duncani TaxID=323732 RepID=A0AAD9PL54_9APIC|nr:bifunctional ABC transporter-like [Babesia duncani]
MKALCFSQSNRAKFKSCYRDSQSTRPLLLSRDGCYFNNGWSTHASSSNDALPSWRFFSVECRRSFSQISEPPKSDFDTSRNQTRELRLFDLLWPKDVDMKQRIAMSMLFLLLSKIFIIGIPVCMSALVDSMSGAVNSGNDILTSSGLAGLLSLENMLPQAYLLGYVLSRLCASALSEVRNAIFSTVMERTSRLNGSNMFLKIHSLDIDYLISSKSGEIASIFTRGTRAISQMLRVLVFQIVPTVLEFGMVTGLLCYKVGPAVASVTALTMILYVGFTAMVSKKRITIRQKMVAAEQRASGVFIDCITNSEAVRYYNSEHRELNRYTCEQRSYEKHAVDVQKTLAFLNFGQHFIFNGGLFTSLLLTLNKVQMGIANFGDLILVNTLLFQLAMPLNMIGTMYRETRMSLVDLQSFLALMREQPRVQNLPGATELVLKAGKIEFCDIKHAYPQSNGTKSVNVLENFSLTVEGGKTIAIVGYSGSGKSTISKLLFRLYDPSEGKILIDGQDIKNCTLESLRNCMGIVPQDVLLFNESVAYNIRYGNPDATLDQIVDAARLAGIHKTIVSTPQGYDTLVGERGIKFSGGEKQRIGIARCLLKNPRILLLDEATSSLDTMTENTILKTLKKLSANRTTIIIAHRLSSILNADNVAVFSNGKIIEQGPPRRLMQENSGYLKQVLDSHKKLI